MSSTSDEMTFLEHLDELRSCLIRVFVSLLIAFAVCAFFAKALYQLLAQPLLAILPEGSSLIFTHPLEAWLTYLKTAFFASIFVASPLVFGQIWTFVRPALFKKERRLGLAFVLGSTLFFLGGGAFAYFVVFPQALTFLVSVTQGTGIQFLPQMKDYLSFAFRLMVAFGLSFELPLFLYFLGRVGVVTVDHLRRFRKYMVVVAFLVAAILTPPDVISQVLMGIPILGLYELGVLLVRVSSRTKDLT